MKTTTEYLRDARQKVEAGIEAENRYCIELTKARRKGATDNTAAAFDAAGVSFNVARRAVRALYKRNGLDAPKMPTIYIVEIMLNRLEERITNG